MKNTWFTKKISKSALTILSVFVLGGNAAQAGENTQTGIIKADFEKFETILNAQAEPDVLMEFLHNKISKEAEFTLSVANPDEKQAEPSEVTMSKADYINSYLYGPRQIEHYNIDIQVKDVRWDTETQTGLSEEIYVETGTMKNPYNAKHDGRPFTSRTRCYSVHKPGEEAGTTVVKSATCSTDIIFEQAV